MPQYVRRIRAGAVNLRSDIRIERERAGMALLDCDNAMGHLVIHRAVELAAEARVASVGSHQSNHAGPASLYARIPLRQGMIGLYVAVGNATCRTGAAPSSALDQSDRDRLPGERTHRVEQENRRLGIAIHPALERSLGDLAAALAIAPL